MYHKHIQLQALLHIIQHPLVALCIFDNRIHAIDKIGINLSISFSYLVEAGDAVD